MPILIGLIARWSALRPVLARVWPVLALAGLVVGGAAWLHGHDRRVLAARDAAVAARAAPAHAAAAAQRAADGAANLDEREAYHDAIAAAAGAGPGVAAAPDPADVALACERLRRAGFGHAAGC